MKKKLLYMSLDAKRARAVDLEDAANEHRRLQDEIMGAERVAALLPLVGKYYKTLNRYSIGDAWWLYAKVLGVEGNGRWAGLRTLQFQEDNGGRVTVEYDKTGITITSDTGGWTEITRREFNAAARKIARKVSKLLTNR